MLNLDHLCGFGTKLLKTWDISEAVYDNKSLNFIAEDASGSGLFFSTDGTKCYVLGTQYDVVRQYSLSNPWDVSTAVYAGKNSAVGSTQPTGLFISPDGLKLFAGADAAKRVDQYTLSTAWDVTTASASVGNYFTNTQITSQAGLWMNAEMSTMWVLDISGDVVYQYTLGTPGTIASASYSGKSFSVAAQGYLPCGITLSPDMKKMFISERSANAVHQYTLSTAGDVSTASYDNVSLAVTGAYFGLFIGCGGSKLYVSTDTSTVRQYGLN